ncbi:MAG: hypothetical protein HPY69_05785 [Armatimonadetes bacterium]|nr:hypothetical protein [Armatimonadota bacterium]
MAQTTVRAAGRSRMRLLVLALPVLLVVAVVVNLGSIKQVASGERSLRSIIYGISMGKGDGLMGWKVPRDTGSEKAKVTIEAFLAGGEACHVQTALVGTALGKIDPERIRVKFVDAKSGPTAIKRREEVRLGCDQGFAVNGKTEFEVPAPEKGKGAKRTVFLAHNHFSGGASPMEVLHPVLDQELKKAYNGKGLGMTPEEFATRLQSGVDLARGIMEAEAQQARAQQAEGQGSQ